MNDDDDDEAPPEESGHITAEGVPDVLRAIVTDLQQHPERYRWFGAWWWPVKAMLRRAGHGPLLGARLGPYLDKEALATLPAGLRPEEVLTQGLREYAVRARFDRSPEWVDAPNGDRIRMHDPDFDAYPS